MMKNHADLVKPLLGEHSTVQIIFLEARNIRFA